MINIKGIRALAKKCAHRPVLQCINYKDKKAQFTDSYYLLEWSVASGDGRVNVLDCTIETELTYPNIENIIKGRDWREGNLKPEIIDNEMYYCYMDGNREFLIDRTHIKTIESLLLKYKFSPCDVEVSRNTCRIKHGIVDLYFVTKAKGVN
jgi:hypothetical protein